MLEVKNINSKDFVSARELHEMLLIKKWFTQWFDQNKERAFLVEGKDFLTSKLESTGGRQAVDYLLTKDSAISVIIISGGQNAKKVRDEVIKTFQQKQTGALLNHKEFAALMDISQNMMLISVQKDVEKKHFELYNNKYEWYKYRAHILGYDTNSLRTAMAKVNQKHKSIRKSLMKLDADELIRTGVIDLFMALGKTKEYSINMGNLAKEISRKFDLGINVWNDNTPNPLEINSTELNRRKRIETNMYNY